ncbi:hypothetical protein FV222_27225, partial [Methylobacterium sp. WL103]
MRQHKAFVGGPRGRHRAGHERRQPNLARRKPCSSKPRRLKPRRLKPRRLKPRRPARRLGLRTVLVLGTFVGAAGYALAGASGGLVVLC